MKPCHALAMDLEAKAMQPWTRYQHMLDFIPEWGDDRYLWCRCGFFASKTANGQGDFAAHQCRLVSTRWVELAQRAPMAVEHTCHDCGRLFHASRRHARFCSPTCRKRASLRRKKEGNL